MPFEANVREQIHLLSLYVTPLLYEELCLSCHGLNLKMGQIHRELAFVGLSFQVDNWINKQTTHLQEHYPAAIEVPR
jgi:hypothetical protein